MASRISTVTYLKYHFHPLCSDPLRALECLASSLDGPWLNICRSRSHNMMSSPSHVRLNVGKLGGRGWLFWKLGAAHPRYWRSWNCTRWRTRHRAVASCRAPSTCVTSVARSWRATASSKMRPGCGERGWRARASSSNFGETPMSWRRGLTRRSRLCRTNRTRIEQICRY